MKKLLAAILTSLSLWALPTLASATCTCPTNYPSSNGCGWSLYARCAGCASGQDTYVQPCSDNGSSCWCTDGSGNSHSGACVNDPSCCTGSTPVLNYANGECVQCTANTDCGATQVCTNNVCVASTCNCPTYPGGSCGWTVYSTCGGCGCGNGQDCVTSPCSDRVACDWCGAGHSGGCQNDPSCCTGSTPYDVSGTCVQCRTSADCNGCQTCSNGSCVANAAVNNTNPNNTCGLCKVCSNGSCANYSAQLGDGNYGTNTCCVNGVWTTCGGGCNVCGGTGCFDDSSKCTSSSCIGTYASCQNPTCTSGSCSCPNKTGGICCTGNVWHVGGNCCSDSDCPTYQYCASNTCTWYYCGGCAEYTTNHKCDGLNPIPCTYGTPAYGCVSNPVCTLNQPNPPGQFGTCGGGTNVANMTSCTNGPYTGVCCSGICDGGANCCSNSDCAGSQTCNSGVCTNLSCPACQTASNHACVANTGGICCNGNTWYSGGTCCINSDCSANYHCDTSVTHTCVPNCTNTCPGTLNCGTGNNCTGSCNTETTCYSGTNVCGQYNTGYYCGGQPPYSCNATTPPNPSSCTTGPLNGGTCSGYQCPGGCSAPAILACGPCSDGYKCGASGTCFGATESAATWLGGSVSPNSISPGSAYTVSCNFNAVVPNGGITLSHSNAGSNNTPGGTCGANPTWVGTVATFSCTAGDKAGSDNITCNAVGGTNDFCANQSQLAGSLTVTGPAAPSGLNPSCPFPGNTLSVSWNAVGGSDPAATYSLRVDDNADGATISPAYPTSGNCSSASGKDICVDGINGTSYTGTNRGTGYDTYNIWAFAIDQYGNWSTASAPETMNALCVGQPTSPVINTITCPSPGSWLTVTWSADMHAASYKVQVIDNTSNTTVLPTTNVGNVLTYSLATNPGDQFTVNVWACDSSGNCSNPTPAGPVICTALGTPSGLTGSTFPSPCAAPGTSMTLNWTGVANAQTYNVLVHDQNTSTNISAPGLVVTSYNAVTTPGDEYNYTVQACQVDGNGHNTCGPTATSPAAGYIDCQLPDPTIIPTCNGISNWLIQLAWSPVTNASNYSVSLQDTNLHPIWPGCPSPNNSPAGDACFTNVVPTSENYQGIEGHSYNTWVQAVDRNGYASPGGNLTPFSCPLPPCGNGTICGLVTSLETGLALPNVPVDLYSVSGAFLEVNNTAAFPTNLNGITYNYAFSGAGLSAPQYYVAPETTGSESSLPARQVFTVNGIAADNFQIYGAHGSVQFSGQIPGTYILLTTATYSGSNPPTISANSPVISPNGIVDTNGNLTIPVAPGYPYYFTCWLPSNSTSLTTTRKPSIGSSLLQGGAQLTTSTALTAQTCPP